MNADKNKDTQLRSSAAAKRRSYAVRTDRPADDANPATRPQRLDPGWARRQGSHLAAVLFRVEDGLGGPDEAAALRPVAGEKGHGGNLLRRRREQTLLQRHRLESDTARTRRGLHVLRSGGGAGIVAAGPEAVQPHVSAHHRARHSASVV